MLDILSRALRVLLSQMHDIDCYEAINAMTFICTAGSEGLGPWSLSRSSVAIYFLRTYLLCPISYNHRLQGLTSEHRVCNIPSCVSLLYFSFISCTFEIPFTCGLHLKNLNFTRSLCSLSQLLPCSQKVPPISSHCASHFQLPFFISLKILKTSLYVNHLSR